ncbi:hypothetical protein AK812_SmicGene3172 [Symbiodinium microadriaticum]|uniref:Uncharacterized protein n=1 Tax=Symbiodinium microadriaticum TaxID=2951 RepID=A0A1Q9EZU6_SYMMI|nr:hypothetical protein AK812_SmicGene3172 [Symbiodinium microadriaticum]CAE7204239.1 unnamed protein product [Symbiodinium microadriaticum]
MPELLGGSKLTPLTDLEPLKIGTNEKGFKEVCNMDNRAVGLPSMNLYGAGFTLWMADLRPQDEDLWSVYSDFIDTALAQSSAAAVGCALAADAAHRGLFPQEAAAVAATEGVRAAVAAGLSAEAAEEHEPPLLLAVEWAEQQKRLPAKEEELERSRDGKSKMPPEKVAEMAALAVADARLELAVAFQAGKVEQFPTIAIGHHSTQFWSSARRESEMSLLRRRR